MIVKIEKSPKTNKRYRVTVDNGKTYDFGLANGSTYLDHHDKKKRYNYWQRHLANKTEQKLLVNLVPSASLFSLTLLWGPSTKLDENITILNNLWKQKHGGSFLSTMRNIGHSLGKPFEKLPVNLNPFDLGYQAGLQIGDQLNKVV